MSLHPCTPTDAAPAAEGGPGGRVHKNAGKNHHASIRGDALRAQGLTRKHHESIECEDNQGLPCPQGTHERLPDHEGDARGVFARNACTDVVRIAACNDAGVCDVPQDDADNSRLGQKSSLAKLGSLKSSAHIGRAWPSWGQLSGTTLANMLPQSGQHRPDIDDIGSNVGSLGNCRRVLNDVGQLLENFGAHRVRWGNLPRHVASTSLGSAADAERRTMAAHV